jgi:insertion element IS1 protein InsB
VITEEQRNLIERLLVERISLRGICRAVGVGLRWFLHFMVERFQGAPEHLYVMSPSSTQRVILQRVEAELDELWSFVGKRANRHWIWMAMDATTRQVIAFHVGDRSQASAEQLWATLPAVYRERGMFYTDQ